jgi:hypothetical protein
MLGERIAQDLVAAQKAGDAFRVQTIRFLIAQLKNRSIEKRSAGSGEILTDTEVIEVLQREAKKRREAIDIYANGGRADLAEREHRELKLVLGYLPKPMEQAEVVAVVRKLAAEGNGGFKVLMKAAMGELKGKADGKLIAEAVKTVIPQ